MQCEIRRSAQVRRRLHLLRLYAEPELRYRGSQSDERRTEAHRRTIHRLSRQAAAKLHRGVSRGKAGAANRRAARKGGPAGGCGGGCQAKGDGGRSQGARQSAMRQTFHLLLRVAGAFRENHESEESTVWLVPGQSQTRWLVFPWRGQRTRAERGALTRPVEAAIHRSSARDSGFALMRAPCANSVSVNAAAVGPPHMRPAHMAPFGKAYDGFIDDRRSRSPLLLQPRVISR